MSTPQENIAKLCATFAANEHEFINGNIYIKERSICERLDQVDPQWNFLPDPHVQTIRIVPSEADTEGIQVTVFATLTVNGITRGNSGTAIVEWKRSTTKDGVRLNIHNEAVKSATTDALKRCARLHGIGRYLLMASKKVTDSNLQAWLDYLAKNGYPPEQDDDAANNDQEDDETAPSDAVVSFEIVQSRKDAKKKLLKLTLANGDICWEFERTPFIDAGWFTREMVDTVGAQGTFEPPIPVRIIQTEDRLTVDRDFLKLPAQ
jgi:hypothetical protein